MQDDFRPAYQEPGHMPVAEPPAQNTNPNHPHHTPPPKPKGWHKISNWYHHLSKKQKIVMWSVIAGLLIASALIWWFAIRKPAEPPKKEAVKKVLKQAAKPTTVASRLTGMQISPELNNLPTTAIMIENSVDARPQSGLYQAGVVYEAIAEGGITRFSAIYMETSPEYIGPVRSVRPYYLDFMVPYDAAIVHAGGSAQALAEVKNYRNIEAFQNPDYFTRVPNRVAPHNLYTNRVKLLELQNSKGWGTSTFTGFARNLKPSKPNPTPQAKSINFNISSALFNPHYDYVPAANAYARSEGGAPHMDEKLNLQLAPQVVVALVMSRTNAGIYSVYGTTGTGEMFVFQGGKVQKGTWSKPNRNTQFTFSDEGGAPLKLDPGQTWVTIVSSPSEVTYSP